MRKRFLPIMAVLWILLLTCGFSDRDQKIYDYGELLSDEEEQELQNLCVQTAMRDEMDIIILTVKGLDGKSPMEYADDFYDDHAFGFEKPHGTGILFLVDMEGRNWWISTSGKCMDYFSVDDTDAVGRAAAGYLSSGQYRQAFVTFVEKSSEVAQTSIAHRKLLRSPLIPTGIAVVVAVIVCLILHHRQKTPMTVNSRTYVQQSQILNEYDHYTHTTTVTRRIQTNSGSGGSGAHVSSGGHSHGGSGGRF